MFYIKGYSKSDYFYPIYVGKAKNIGQRWKDHYSNIKASYNDGFTKSTELKYKKISEYLKHKNLQPKNIKFKILEEIVDYVSESDKVVQAEKYWMQTTKADARGFNQMHANGRYSNPSNTSEMNDN